MARPDLLFILIHKMLLSFMKTTFTVVLTDMPILLP